MYYRSEAQSCTNRLRQSDQERHQVIADLRSERQASRQLQSDLETTRKGYEDQLNTMTEELAQYLNPATVWVGNFKFYIRI